MMKKAELEPVPVIVRVPKAVDDFLRDRLKDEAQGYYEYVVNDALASFLEAEYTEDLIKDLRQLLRRFRDF